MEKIITLIGNKTITCKSEEKNGYSFKYTFQLCLMNAFNINDRLNYILIISQLLSINLFIMLFLQGVTTHFVK